MNKKNGYNNCKQQLLLDLFQAYFDARKNKRKTANARAFEKNYEEKLFKLHGDIVNRRYEIGPSVGFIVQKPVKREVFAADFRDRIVHHLIFNYINPVFEKGFIKDSYSCRAGKGTSYGIKRVSHFVRSCSQNYQKDCWILKLDIRGYFMSMNRNILYAKIEKRLQKENFDTDLVLYLIRKVVFNDATKNCHIKGDREDWVGLPKSKSLLFAKEGDGFPIGNLTSQLFGNIYLDEFDHFVGKKLGIKHYGRYVDDMVFVHVSRKFLKKAIAVIGKFLRDVLSLILHPKKIYLQHFSKGVQFLGTFVRPWSVYVAKRIKGNFYAKIQVWNELVENRDFLKEKEVKEFICSVNSYLGIMKHYQTFKLRRKMIDNNLSQKFWEYVGVCERCEKIVYLGI